VRPIRLANVENCTSAIAHWFAALTLCELSAAHWQACAEVLPWNDSVVSGQVEHWRTMRAARMAT